MGESSLGGLPQGRVTVRIGLAGTPDPALTCPDQLIAAVDDAPYRAKRGGRNRVVVATDAPGGGGVMPSRILVVEDEPLVGRIFRERPNPTPARIPVLALTAAFNPATRHRAMSRGAGGCLPKTEIGEAFIEKVLHLLGQVRKEQRNG